MSEKTRDMAGWIRVAGLGALLVAACVPTARAACNVGPFTDVEVEYYATNAIGTNLPALYVGVGATSVYYASVATGTVGVSAWMEYRSEAPGTFEFVTNGVQSSFTNLGSTYFTITGLVAGASSITTWGSTNVGTYDITCGVIQVTSAELTKLALTNAACSNGVVDTTLSDEAQAASNTLYLCEGSNGTAEMQVKAEWLPTSVASNMFRWEIKLTNGTATKQWSPTNTAAFSSNPASITWTNKLDTNGLTNREFVVNAWFDQNTNGVFDPGETHRRLNATVLKVDFTNRVGMINYGFDPDYCLWTGTPWPWTSVDKEGTNNVCKLIIEPASAANQIEVVMASGGGCASVSPTNFTTGSTDLTITGQGSGGDAIAHARIKVTTTPCAELNIIAMTNRSVEVGVYFVEDGASTNTSPVGGPSSAELLNTLDDLYQQAHVSFTLLPSCTTNVAYDSSGYGTNFDGKYEFGEETVLDPANNSRWNGDVWLFFIKKSGIPYTGAPSLFIRGYSEDGEMYGVIFTDDCGTNAAIAAAHEIGHVLGMAKRDDDGNKHDLGTWPVGEENLMRPGLQGGVLQWPGRWLRHEDWREANQKAGAL